MSGSPQRRIGVLGGTFDPPHNGHVLAAARAVGRLGLDLLLLTVANDPWQKTAPIDGEPDIEVSPAVHRLTMVVAAADGLDGVEADDMEIQHGGPTYTADTLVALVKRYPGAELVLLVGADVAVRMGTWARPEEVRRHATIVVMTRPGSDQIRLPEGWQYQVLEVPAYDISSTEVRRRVAAGEVISELVPAGVALVIEEAGLYRGAG